MGNPSIVNLISWWKYDESSGNAADTKGTYTLTNTGSVAYVAGILGNSADLGTANSTKYFTRADQLGLTINATRSFGCTFKVRTELSGGDSSYPLMYFGYANGGAGVEWLLRYQRTSAVNYVDALRVRPGAGVEGPSYGTTLGTASWHQLVAVLNGTNLRVYLDGVDRGNATVGTANGAGAPDVFRMGQAWSSYANAYIDESFVFNDALTADECSWLYNSGSFMTYNNLLSGGYIAWY